MARFCCLNFVHSSTFENEFNHYTRGGILFTYIVALLLNCLIFALKIEKFKVYDV